MPKTSSLTDKKAIGGVSLGKGNSPQKVFSVEDVAKLVEIARNQLRKEKKASSGWKEVDSKESKLKEKAYARELADGYRSSPEFKCWQCDKPGHKSSECPKGERCFVCNSQGHKRAECPVKRRATREEKGKSVDVEAGHHQQKRRPTTGVIIGDQWPVVGKGLDLPRNQTFKEREEDSRQAPLHIRAEWKQVPESRSKSTYRPGRQLDAGEAMASQRPGRQLDVGETMRWSRKARMTSGPDFEGRQGHGQPVFLTKSVEAVAEREGLIATGGVLSRVNGDQ